MDVVTVSSLLGDLPYAFLRAVGFCALLPFPTSYVPLSIRLLLALVIAVATFQPGVDLEPDSLFVILAIATSEFLYGFLLALPYVLLFVAVEIWGELFDLGRGMSFAAFYDPQSAKSSQLFPILLRAVLGTILFFSGLLEEILVHYLTASSVVAAGTLPGVELSEIGALVLEAVNLSLSAVFVVFLPFAVLFLLVDLGLGFLARIIRGIPVYSEAFLLKSLSGFTGLLLVLFNGSSDDVVFMTRVLAPFESIRQIVAEVMGYV